MPPSYEQAMSIDLMGQVPSVNTPIPFDVFYQPPQTPSTVSTFTTPTTPVNYSYPPQQQQFNEFVMDPMMNPSPTIQNYMVPQ